MEEVFIENKNVRLCVEVFGSSSFPAIILIAGAAGQGILWNKSFCEKLAEESYFVIRFDHRDTGKSSSVDYKTNPYNLLNMAEDVVKILDKFAIKKAHVIGMSMGGYIAQFLAKFFPERIKSVVLFMTTINSLALRGIRKISKLPGQDAAVISEIAKIYQQPRINLDDKIKSLVETWRLFNGEGVFFPDKECYAMAADSYTRAIGKNAMKNHRLAVLHSEADRTEYLKKITQPVLIIHGALDPIIRVQHAVYTKECIPSAKLCIVNKMGHLFTSPFNNQILDVILNSFAEWRGE